MTDAELVAAVVAGDPVALGTLHRRHADLVLAIARRELDRAGAEDVVQDVFLAVWNRAETFDSARGDFRSWLARVARTRVLNELRRRGRHPAEALEVDQADPLPPPDESIHQALRGRALREALAVLPLQQRQAIGLAFFDELTHRELATAMQVPLGTAKSRIRDGLRRLAVVLGPVMLVAFALRLVAVERRSQVEDRALHMVTTSDVTSVRIPAASGRDPSIHGTWRYRDSTLAVLTVSGFPADGVYVAWSRHGGDWSRLGVVSVGADGRGLLIVEGDPAPPEGLEVTVETTRWPAAPGEAVVSWPSAAGPPAGP